MAKSMEVFRDLNLRGSLARRSDLRQALIAAANDPWYYDLGLAVITTACRRSRCRESPLSE